MRIYSDKIVQKVILYKKRGKEVNGIWKPSQKDIQLPPSISQSIHQLLNSRRIKHRTINHPSFIPSSFLPTSSNPHLESKRLANKYHPSLLHTVDLAHSSRTFPPRSILFKKNTKPQQHESIGKQKINGCKSSTNSQTCCQASCPWLRCCTPSKE